MANRLATRGASIVGPNWAYNFVKRQPKLKTRFSHKYESSIRLHLGVIRWLRQKLIAVSMLDALVD